VERGVYLLTDNLVIQYYKNLTKHFGLVQIVLHMIS